MKVYGRRWGKNWMSHRLRLLALAITIWLVLPFMLILDLVIELYHRTAFPYYGAKPLKRGDYIIIDRGKLSYLNLIQKINCIYCGYANGVISYWLAIANETELYWCGIKHRKTPKIKPAHYDQYAKYGDPNSIKPEHLGEFNGLAGK